MNNRTHIWIFIVIWAAFAIIAITLALMHRAQLRDVEAWRDINTRLKVVEAVAKDVRLTAGVAEQLNGRMVALEREVKRTKGVEWR